MDDGEVCAVSSRPRWLRPSDAPRRRDRRHRRVPLLLPTIVPYVPTRPPSIPSLSRKAANHITNPPHTVRFYGMSENAREVELDMQEMVAKVKAGEPLYGESKLSPHLQGVAARQSRYSALFFAALPWFNFVNHSQHGIDTAKYYVRAEQELEAERAAGRDSS